ncbi:vitamin B12-dependent ribonucleotide reductase large subunit NrdJ [Acetobacterium woodii DSM 1030]|uniref:Vitamin B12-dependent ribonucleotide reductase n=1 Tax=Acetobacterium woodii (strain ATCC 29683 / DSM 1030 / JCM 2381 / KCTC 1655 / WB1) TaxID=931626 RepID=H6LJZ0_ACEWD|nr:vitamin B12-dependent ribonucleotide reductase large subunit NrdJ [Acetobacterium woodii DSM 1030]
MKELNQLFKRVFTKELENTDKTVYDLFQWQTVDVSLKNYQTGEIIYEMKDLEFPEHYSQNACNIIATKYFRRKGVPNQFGYEHSMREIADRLVGFWADAIKEEGLIDTDEEWQIYYDELVYAFLMQMWAPNSPQWFNTGLMRNYKISGSKDDLYYYDEKTGTVMESEDRYTRTQASACFILSIQDRLLGAHSISEHYVSETKLFKGGSGVGTNFSSLRGVNESLTSGGQSSGMMSFLQGLDRNAGAIKSGGTTRRAAKMVIVDIDHPEIDTFINWKVKEEQKVRALGKMGYDLSMDGEAYQTVSGQNSNNSVRLNAEFMQAVLNLKQEPDHKIKLRGRVDNRVDREVSVHDLWKHLNQATWECADPGIQFDDIFNTWHTCPGGENGNVDEKINRINATNPCSEYAFLDDTACNLASINIFKFYNQENNCIDIDSYIHLIGLIQCALEGSIYHGQFPTKDVARKSYLFRTTGLGIANAASLLLALGYPYDSAESRNLIAGITGVLTGTSYYVSSLIAGKVGAFPKYAINEAYMKRVIRNHSRVAGARTDAYEEIYYEPIKINHKLLQQMGFNDLSTQLKNAWKLAEETGEVYGYRNAQVSVIAPTGTISFAMDCGATSVEPFYNHVVFKKLIGGGSMEIVNPVMETALYNLNYNEKEVGEILTYLLEKDDRGYFLHEGVSGSPHIKPEHLPIFDTANTISPMGHVLMVSSITPMISGSVSKTVNLPNDASVEDVEDIHLLAYRTGTKAIAVYRDGCKASQPLSSGMADDHEKALEEYNYDELLALVKAGATTALNRVRPEGMRLSRTHAAKIGDIELYITIGFYEDGGIAEIFVSTDKEGTVVKGLLASLSKSISNMLQYHIPPDQISKMLRGQKYEPSGFVSRHPYIKFASSISDLMSKVIDIEHGDFSNCQVKPKNFTVMNKNNLVKSVAHDDNVSSSYNKDVSGEVLYGETCSHCGSDRMMQNGTCKLCLDCGTTTGCS